MYFQHASLICFDYIINQCVLSSITFISFNYDIFHDIYFDKSFFSVITYSLRPYNLYICTNIFLFFHNLYIFVLIFSYFFHNLYIYFISRNDFTPESCLYLLSFMFVILFIKSKCFEYNN